MASEEDVKTLRAAALKAALEGDGDRAEQIIAVGNMVEAGNDTQEDPPK
jgi:hypothetical protein